MLSKPAICVDENGDVVTGASWGTGGDPAMVSKIQAVFPAGDGFQPVTLDGQSIDLVMSMGKLDYSATLTLIPR